MKKTAVAAVALVAAIGGCSTRKVPAPVVDARPPLARPVAVQPPAARAAPAAAPSVSASADFYTVKRGDTLYSIALDQGADYRDIAAWNQLEDPAKLRVGQQLRLTPPPAPEKAVEVAPVRGPARIEARRLEATLEKKAEPKSEPFGSAFIWPVKGKVLAEFSEPRRKGIDIEARAGEPVLAAAPGRVTYSGTGIPGMGKLVVIKHANGYITVYAHNRDIVVKEQQEVARGQKIAESGSTDADRPKLHFQIRKGASAVDPLLYLPKP